MRCCALLRLKSCDSIGGFSKEAIENTVNQVILGIAPDGHRSLANTHQNKFSAASDGHGALRDALVVEVRDLLAG